MPYPFEDTTMTKKKNNRTRRKNKVRQPQDESVNMIKLEYDHLLASPFLAKKDDLGIPTIKCTIGQRIFHKTFCDIGSGVNIMSKVMYEY